MVKTVKKSKELQYYEAIGRRREATVRVRLYITHKDKETIVGSVKIKPGEIMVNKKPVQAYFPALAEKVTYLKPLKLTDSEVRFAISILTRGGGRAAQLEAMVLGISRALIKVNPTYRPALKKAGYLTRDARIRQRRRVGMGGKSRRAKQSPKR